MFKFTCPKFLANAAAALAKRYGAVNQQAKQAQCSRKTVWKHGKQVEQLAEQFQQLKQQNQDLRQQNQQLHQQLQNALPLDTDKLQQFAMTAAAEAVSINQTRALLEVLLPAERVPARSTLHHWIGLCADKAVEVLAVLDEVTQPFVQTVALDEVFARRTPILMAVEPGSMAWLAGQRGPDRTGESWLEVLKPFSRVELALADDGAGLQRGLTLWRQAREDACETTDAIPLFAAQDHFHIIYKATPLLQRQWRRVKQAVDDWEQAEHKVASLQKRGFRLQRAQKEAGFRGAFNRAKQEFAVYEDLESAWTPIRKALRFFDDQGRLNRRSQIAESLEGLLEKLPDAPEWTKIKVRLRAPETWTFLEHLESRLAKAEPHAELREACLHLYELRRAGDRASAALEARSEEAGSGRLVVQELLQERVCAGLSPQWRQSYALLSSILDGGLYRASSCVECVNSVVRMHQSRHRQLTQRLLHLKRLWWNVRRFRGGCRKGKSPYELLGLGLPSCDLWTLIHTPPDVLRSLLATPLHAESAAA